MAEYRYDYNKTDFIAFNDLCNFDCQTFSNINDIETSTMYFYNYVYNLVDKHVHKVKINPQTYPKLYATELIKTLEKKSSTQSSDKYTKNPSDYIMYSLCS